MDARIEAIRNDSVVGKNTCSIVDECYDDSDLANYLNEVGITEPSLAVADARYYLGCPICVDMGALNNEGCTHN